MKYSSVLSILVITLCSSLMIEAADKKSCQDQAKAITINITECCNFPDFFDMNFLNQTVQQVMSTGKANPGTPLFDCLIEQTVFHNLKLLDDKGGIDASKVSAVLSDLIKDPAWKKAMLAVVPKCITDSPKYAEAYQKVTGIAKSECDFKYDAFSDCMDMNLFRDCPDAAWIKSVPTANATTISACEGAKTFIKECYNDVAAVDAFLDKQHD